MRNEYERAQGQFEEARREFEAVGNRLGAAQCLRSLGDISRIIYLSGLIDGRVNWTNRVTERV